MSREALLIIDFGTSSVHVSLVARADGRVLASAGRSYRTLHPGPGMAEIDPEELWRSSVAAVGETLAKAGDGAAVRAAGFSFFGDSLMPVDREGSPLGNLILCADARGREEAWLLRERLGRRFVELTGEPCETSCAGTKLLWMQKHQSGVFEGAAAFWSVQQWVLFRLGLEPVCDPTMAARYTLYDNGAQRWSEELTAAAGISAERLPRVVPAESLAGTITSYGEHALGGAVPVYTGAHDCECGIVGTGAFMRPGVIANITGTFDHMGVIVPGYLNPVAEDDSLLVCGASGPFAGSSVLSSSFDTAGSVLHWFMESINGDDGQEAYGRMWDACRFDGRSGLFFVPDFADSRGKLVGLDMKYGREDLFAALIEGITFEVLRQLDSYRRYLPDAVSTVRVGGGPSRAEKWMQLRADVFGCPVETMRNPEVSGMGAAVLTAVAAGLCSGAEEAAGEMLGTGRRYEPDMENHGRYLEKYGKYLALA